MKINQIRKLKSKKGFTLVELLAVIGIILVLASLAIPAISNALLSAEKAGVKRNVQILNSSYQNYLAAGGTTQPAVFSTAVAALNANETPNPVIGVAGPFLLTTPSATASVGGTDNVTLSFSGKAFYISAASASSGLTVGYGS